MSVQDGERRHLLYWSRLRLPETGTRPVFWQDVTAVVSMCGLDIGFRRMMTKRLRFITNPWSREARLAY